MKEWVQESFLPRESHVMDTEAKKIQQDVQI